MMDDSFKTVYVTIKPEDIEDGESAALVARHIMRKTMPKKDNDDSADLLSLDEIPWLDMFTASMGDLGKSLDNKSRGVATRAKPRAVVKSSSARENRKKNQLDQKKLDFFRLLNKVKSENDWDAEAVIGMLDETPVLAKKKYLFSAFKEPVMALHYMCAFNAPMECVKKCYRQHPDALHDASPSLGTPLHYACHYNVSNRIVRYLASRDLPALVVVNRGKRTPLHTAVAQQSDTDLVVLLTEACPEAAAIMDKDNMTPLDLAVSLPNPNLAVVEDLTEVNPLAIASALPKAILNDAVEYKILKDMMLSNPKALCTPDKNKDLPLHNLVKANRSYKEIKFCMLKYPQATHATNGQGMTPFGLAKSMQLDDDLIDLLKPNDDYLFG
jgi:ankyrin repeat protein